MSWKARHDPVCSFSFSSHPNYTTLPLLLIRKSIRSLFDYKLEDSSGPQAMVHYFLSLCDNKITVEGPILRLKWSFTVKHARRQPRHFGLQHNFEHRLSVQIINAKAVRGRGSGSLHKTTWLCSPVSWFQVGQNSWKRYPVLSCTRSYSAAQFLPRTCHKIRKSSNAFPTFYQIYGCCEETWQGTHEKSIWASGSHHLGLN